MRLGIIIAMLMGIAHPASAAEELDMQQPTIGRIVHYQAHGSPDGTHPSVPRAAIVTAVHDDTTVDLCVLSPNGQFFNQRCEYSAAPKGGTWRWPARADTKACEPSDVLPILEESIARIAHEANRAYCLALGDTSQPAWDDAPEWQRTSAINGVKFHLANPGASPSASHDNWLAEKLEQGWTYGPVKDPEKKQHPCCVPYDELPEPQKVKDKLFSSIVRAFVA